MKYYLLPALALVAVMAVSASSYAEMHKHKTSIEDVKKETSELIEVLESYSEAKRDEAAKQSLRKNSIL